MNLIKNPYILLLILLNILDITLTETILIVENDDEGQWSKQVANCVESNQNYTNLITEHMAETRKSVREIEKSLHEIQKNAKDTCNKLRHYVNESNPIVIQRRSDGSENFYRSWNEYKNGFGKIEGDFFIGLETLHQLVTGSRYELIITLENFKNVTRYARHNNFVIGNEAEKYALKSVGNYTGSAGDSLSYLVGDEFSAEFDVAWWFDIVSYSMIFGKYSIHSWQYKEKLPYKFFEISIRKYLQ